MTTTVGDAHLIIDLAVPNIRARLSSGTRLIDERLTKQDHIVRLSSQHPDQRFTYLASLGLTKEDLDTVAWLVEDWLSDHRRRSLEDASLEAFQARRGLDYIMELWSQARPYEILVRSIIQSRVPQPDAVLCYAICAATELALSMMMVQKLDSDPHPAPEEPDAAWTEEDQRIAAMDLEEDIVRWPD